MDDDEDHQPGPSRARLGARNGQRMRGFGEGRAPRGRNQSEPAWSSNIQNRFRWQRPGSQTRQLPMPLHNAPYFPNRWREQREHREQRELPPRGEDKIKFTKNDGSKDRRGHGFVGYRKLEEIANSDDNDILVKVNEKRAGFLEIIGKEIDKPDVFVLTIKILSKICKSSFDQLKFKLILEICNTDFIGSLLKYLLDLPYTDMKSKNSMYWNNQEEFWSNIITFCDFIIASSPSTAFTKYRSLVEATKSCLNNLNEQQAFPTTEQYIAKLDELRKKLSSVSSKMAAAQTEKGASSDIHDVQPPDNFRWLNIVPMSVDLSHHTPFLRPNIVKGSYHDVEHYLDVQFRLLREDCFGPLREGVLQFKNDPHKGRYDNIRVFDNVKFVQPYITQGKVGCIVQIDMGQRKNKNLAKIKWEHNKRFIFGSLVLFTKDNCRTFIAATVLDRDSRLLAQGKIPVCLVDEKYDEGLYSQNESYIMIESEIYFEPYYHVMKALQDPSFGTMLPMQEYIVKVQAEHKPPAYLVPDKKFVFDVVDTRKMGTQRNIVAELDLLNSDSDSDSDNQPLRLRQTDNKYDVFRPDTWPSMEEFNLDESQYNAFIHALTHEFAVIQGPPGTGKTFIGLKITKALLDNLEDVDGCLMLVLCYTNHALDQFLEGILNFTTSVARIGGQSKSENMVNINLNNLRANVSRHSPTNKLYFEQKADVDVSSNEFRNGVLLLNILNNGVLAYNCIKDRAPALQLLGEYYGNTTGDIMFLWLFEHSHQFISTIEECLEKYQDNEETEEVKEEINKRKKLLIDYDDCDDKTLNKILKSEELQTTFSLQNAESKLKEMILFYKGNKVQDELSRRRLAIEIQVLDSQVSMFKIMSQSKSRRVNRRINHHTNFQYISAEDRWALYFEWIEPLVETIRDNVAVLQRSLAPKITTLEESRMLTDLEVLKNRRVVAMTTSGAARLRKLIKALDPPIVIIEEAAEVLEQHIITSLTKNSQHVILIGDHQQLRPSASHMKLARKFDLEVSLFERMVRNGVHSRRLGVQHRMRPELAALVAPHIYAELDNHASVCNRPDVLGLQKNLFFFTHDYIEEPQTDSNRSRTNHKEADITLALANYIIMQGYSADEVTILTTYSGQMFYLRKERAKYHHLQGVKITVVDNYQGEECRIILLSLVRNNEEGKIGFLATENRVCVALSRAKEGFYIFGNIDILKKNSPLWQNIARTLENMGSLGSSLVLKCERHQEYNTVINNLEDFEKVPEGGCNLICNLELSCGHNCELFCHGYDRAHKTNATRCHKKCERTICELDHKCPYQCWQECKPCEVLMTKTLPCKHLMNLYCHIDPEDKSVKCCTEVPCTLPACQHAGKKMCHEDLAKVRCTERCIYRLDCGHACMRTCHVNNDPDHEKYICKKQCERMKNGCTVVSDDNQDLSKHVCDKLCHEQCSDCTVEVVKKRTKCKHIYKVACNADVDAIVCRKNCARSLPCGHFCKSKCFEECGNCVEKVKKIIPECGHEIIIACHVEPTRALCNRKCERVLQCGHRCKSLCSKPCDRGACAEPSTVKHEAPYGHRVDIPCNLVEPLTKGTVQAEVLLKHCTERCGAELACGHVCQGSCAACHHGRLHAPCQQPCRRPIICGHECTEPCNQVCPPCQRPCEVKCAHSTCNKKCGQPCTPCKEACTRSCPHGACARRCDARCSVPPCERACARRLPCGHACRGLCGEPCPDICKQCRPDDFPRGLIGEEFEDDDKFIQLLDCGHILCVDDADGLMNSHPEEVHIRTCPMCRKPIINTNRYKDIVNDSLKNEIGPIKQKIYGHPKDIIQKREELSRKYNEAKLQEKVESNACLKQKFLHLYSVITQKKQASRLELEMQLIYLNILTLTADCYATYKNVKYLELKGKVEEQIIMICSILETTRKKYLMVKKISEQQQTDALNEIKRLNSIVQFSKLLSHNSYIAVKEKPEVVTAVKAAHEVVFSLKTFNQEKATETMKKLQDTIKVSGCLSMDEIQMVIRAVKDIPQSGHWFKCPNGHFYAIGECGGAMEVSKCADCGAAVGGRSHTLLADNAHAREIDGSRFPKWSEQYNNMANFDLNIIE
ncbi:NFX1-type zinc finger-containing protein 1 [Manduca sexta]|uniref:RZ-type domain-containing protein n=1 Tax=Manduca sexta TaxID=7130 RepID=A0A921Z732_MANSE|nr:NFX1-type zinc finger-containing protein 1 [Manduca sexta]KAG6452108.1 hypothetical protein O3G_MSEX007481 [Manduca sexta]KAG6452109.1 hypothetical protein O3G_MSEX007481 [Manduca sexta]KAG6452110.1 hypothetical protein O3G_MSEX007481 [Manduca sexta]KAG6452111.1 hypothetical protein O3G_MSEX007481 [Manduca sexta]KAG6452112.1 hypothetical protein O3G_MSEX007481 [Manduca sexta]